MVQNEHWKRTVKRILNIIINYLNENKYEKISAQ